MRNTVYDQSQAIKSFGTYTIEPARTQLFQPVPWQLWSVVLVVAGFGCFSTNPLLMPFSAVLVPILVSLLWFRGEPPVLLFACLTQWLQAAAGMFYTNVSGVSLADPWRVSEIDLAQATWLSLVGVLALGLGMRVALPWRTSGVVLQAESESKSLQASRIFIVYLIAFVVFLFIDEVALHIPTLIQPLRATVTVKWILVFLLAYCVIKQERHYALLGIAVAIEFVFGFSGYFSGFKSVFFMLVVVLPTAQFILKGGRLVQFCAVIALVLLIMVVWSAIKGEYREFLNQGSGQQVVVVSASERVKKAGELVVSLDLAKLQEGFEKFVARVSYVEFFAATIAFVPAYLPYENGSLWLGTIEHVLAPRFLFPDKGVIDDSFRTATYTGIRVAGVSEGTSISIGYMGESYIDFGPVGMFAPIFLLGLFYGLIYRFFIFHHSVKVIGFAMATSIILFGAYNLETSNIKLVGGNTMSVLVIGLFSKIASPWFWRLITNPMDHWLPEYTATHMSKPGTEGSFEDV